MTPLDIISNLLTADMTNWFFAVFLASLTMILMAVAVRLRIEVRELHRASRALGAEATRLKMLRSKRRRA
jgi:HAMP domain-containing protein